MRRGLLGLLLLAGLARAEPPAPPPGPVPVLDLFRVLGAAEADVREISGLAVLPGASDREGTLLVVSDEGRWFASRRTIEGALFRLPYRIAEDDSGLELGEALPVAVRCGEHLPGAVRPRRRDDGLAADWEGIVALPGTTDLFLVSAERAADAENAPANRAYVVRHARDGSGTTDLLAHLALPDLPADGENDRFEGVAVLPADPPEAGRWRVWFFKERTTPAGAVPVVLPARLVREGDAFRLDPAPGAASAFRLAEEAAVVATQADAAAAPDGSVWVLDRWRREVHRARPEEGRPSVLARAGAVDLWETVREVRGEAMPIGSSAPGRPDRPGYGLHEGIAFDASGRLFLAADRGEALPSVVTLLAPSRER